MGHAVNINKKHFKAQWLLCVQPDLR